MLTYVGFLNITWNSKRKLHLFSPWFNLNPAYRRSELCSYSLLEHRKPVCTLRQRQINFYILDVVIYLPYIGLNLHFSWNDSSISSHDEFTNIVVVYTLLMNSSKTFHRCSSLCTAILAPLVSALSKQRALNKSEHCM